MRPVDLAYRTVVGGLRALALLAPVLPGKLGRGLAGRRDAHRRLAAWGRAHREPGRPGIWLHAPSVGEGLQARATLRALVGRRPGLQSVYTHFSPSAESFARSVGADAAAYLPWDLRGPVTEALRAAAPDVVAFTKTEVWPVLTEAAAAQGARVALIAGTVPPGAGRARGPARAFLRPTWRRLAMAAAIAEEDGERLVGLGVPREAVRITGDPGIDSAAARAREADPSAPHLAPFHADARPTVVAGSTWPADEAVLVPALVRLRPRVPGLRAVIAPHEPDRVHVELLLGELRRRGWAVATLGRVEREGVEGIDAVVVDRVGVLAHLYTVGSAAYVGGGFHDRGLHSVLEPAAARIPVAFGPRHGNARAAAELAGRGGGRVVSGAEELAEVLEGWLGEPDAAEEDGARAFGYIHAHLGAAERTAALLDELLDDPTPRPAR